LEDVRIGLAELVRNTIGRLENRGVTGPDVQRLLANWNAIAESEKSEEWLCRAMAVLGVDPYDCDLPSDEIGELLQKVTSALPSALAEDLLAGTRLADLPTDFGWVERGRSHLSSNGVGGDICRRFSDVPVSDLAFETGYRFARHLRGLLSGLSAAGPIHNLSSAIEDCLGCPLSSVTVKPPRNHRTRLEAIVGVSEKDSGAKLVVPEVRTESANRFRLARGLFCILSGKTCGSPRILSTAATGLQRASRAFAAELLLPAEALRGRVGGLVGQTDLNAIADEYGVSPHVARHQLENHGLGVVES